MSELVQVFAAGDVTEAEELERILAEAGIAATLRAASEVHPDEHGDVPVSVLVPAGAVDAARDAIEALSEPDDVMP
jgi:pyruvate/2-oxoglutarate dehydrogenase complex dihydrolipoamide dehydrogenase (E3) component